MLLPDQLAAAHHKDLHARLPLRARTRDQIHVQSRTPDHFLLLGHPPNGDDPVAHAGGGLERERLG